MKRLISFIITFTLFCAIFCFVLFREYQDITLESVVSNEAEQGIQDDNVQENESRCEKF